MYHSIGTTMTRAQQLRSEGKPLQPLIPLGGLQQPHRHIQVCSAWPLQAHERYWTT
jgi:hypothetical protein